MQFFRTIYFSEQLHGCSDNKGLWLHFSYLISANVSPTHLFTSALYWFTDSMKHVNRTFEVKTKSHFCRNWTWDTQEQTYHPECLVTTENSHTTTGSYQTTAKASTRQRNYISRRTVGFIVHLRCAFYTKPKNLIIIEEKHISTRYCQFYRIHSHWLAVLNIPIEYAWIITRISFCS